LAAGLLCACELRPCLWEIGGVNDLNDQGPLYDQGYTDYQTHRSSVRRWVRGFYLRSAAGLLEGATIDFGCGIGELLVRLPDGSTGLEINQATVRYCRARGLDVLHYDGEDDGWSLSPLVASGKRYESLVISHVLEHLHDPMRKFNGLLRAARGLGVRRVLAIVPGKAGYASDDTHRTFVDAAMLASREPVEGTGFRLEDKHYYPGNTRAIGDVFLYHELRALYVLHT
jgi:SAM-dependent methyltransferase